ncbi:phosphate regulon transcriptional regulator PhoB [Paremcibacter congregatus]|uniref:Phosphate regulon transcriptional regulatory protein PhoB n=1 Tax=Paremcibacter congregatus TaxID=2043170 RepID=A0A2G4YTQ1_9PROT|nr:phosphate regulon transcriptional regulator PhoB [Paremcibacter congregatus]PHZ85714.1 phosphate regulon transcriptional regulatory protein PhoB [Paremcibacter congregatus]QDE26677.1 phosphate regulon transcriptional regulatory protein PhoB [Paremcibacter congregatus]
MALDTLYILIAEDEPRQAEILKFNLEEEGFRVGLAPDGLKALEMIDEALPDLLILDWMLPEVSGIRIMKKLRKEKETKSLPVIMLTARGEEDDRVRGFEVGVDDYVVKPYLPSELVARVRAVLRRSHPEMQEEKIEYAGIELDLVKLRVSRDGDPVELASTELRLLKALMSHPGRVFSRNRLIDLAWGTTIYLEDRSVDVAVRRLRKALNEGGKADIIRTVRSEGYAIEESASRY